MNLSVSRILLTLAGAGMLFGTGLLVPSPAQAAIPGDSSGGPEPLGLSCDSRLPPGSSMKVLSSIKCRFSLGTIQYYARNGQVTEYSLVVDLYSRDYDTRALSPAALTFPYSAGNGEVLYHNGILRQVRTMNLFTDFVVLTPMSYEMRFYRLDQLTGAKEKGFYTIKPGEVPFKTVIIRDASEGKVQGVAIVEIVDDGGVPTCVNTSRYTWTPQPDGKVANGLETYDVEWGPDMVALRQEKILKRVLREKPRVWEDVHLVQKRGSGKSPWITTESEFYARAEYDPERMVVLKHVRPCAEDGSPVEGSTIEKWAYESDPTKSASFNKPLTYSRSDGYWEKYSYAGDERTGMILTRTVSSWHGSKPEEPDSRHRVETHVEVRGLHGFESDEVQVAGKVESRRWMERTINGARETVERSYELEAGNPGRACPIEVRTYFCNDASEPILTRGRVRRVEDLVEKTVAEYAYASTADGGRIETVTEKSGNPVSKVVRTVTTMDALGREVSTVRTDSLSDPKLLTEGTSSTAR